MPAYFLRVTTTDVIPTDVLVEHLAYAIRTGFQLNPDFDIKVLEVQQ